MKTIGICLFVLLAALAASADAQFYYYDLNGQPIQLSIIDTLVVVRFAETSSASATSFALEQPTLRDVRRYCLQSRQRSGRLGAGQRQQGGTGRQTW